MELNSGTTISFDFRKKKKIKRRGMMNITKDISLVQAAQLRLKPKQYAWSCIVLEQ